MEIFKPLYGLTESGTHWWETYSEHHLDKLIMRTSTYSPCLLITSAGNPSFGLVGMQTDDTFGISDATLDGKEEKEIQRAGFTARPKEYLTEKHPIAFDGGVVTLERNGSIQLRQKGQAQNLCLIDKNTDK